MKNDQYAKLRGLNEAYGYGWMRFMTGEKPTRKPRSGAELDQYKHGFKDANNCIAETITDEDIANAREQTDQPAHRDPEAGDCAPHQQAGEPGGD